MLHTRTSTHFKIIIFGYSLFNFPIDYLKTTKKTPMQSTTLAARWPKIYNIYDEKIKEKKNC